MISSSLQWVRSFLHLHPETKEEYALARRETKVSKGHLGFEVDGNHNLEEDLLRRT